LKGNMRILLQKTEMGANRLVPGSGNGSKPPK
jgi:hypothetical protein